MKQYIIIVVAILVLVIDVVLAHNWVRNNKLNANPQLSYSGTHAEFSDLKSLEGEILFGMAEKLSYAVFEENFDTPDFEKMMIYLTLAAENGYDDALIILAMFYSADTEFRDLERVDSLFKASEQKGSYLLYGEGLLKDFFTPMKIWLRDRKGKSDDGS